MAAAQNHLAIIKVVGIGGWCQCREPDDRGRPQGVEFIAINTDAQALLMSDADVKPRHRRGVDPRPRRACANPDVGTQAADDHADEIEEVLRAPTWSS